LTNLVGIIGVDNSRVDWQQPIDRGPRLARDQLAFLVASAATGLGGTYMLLVAAALLAPIPGLRRFVDDSRWDHFLGGPALIANLFASLLLLVGDRMSRATRSQSLFLVAVNVTGVGFWCAQHAHFFGIPGRIPPLADDPFMALSLRLIALLRIVTLAKLSAEVAVVPGHRDFTSLRRATIHWAVVAFCLWLVLSLTHLDWARRPLAWVNIRDPRWHQVLAGSIFARGISFLFAAILCAQANMSSRSKRKNFVANS
jgi:hypothetical protein